MAMYKPRLRGRIHQVAFYITLAKTLIYIICSIINQGSIGILIYLISQIILFGISSTYHTRTWKSKKNRQLLQRLDHISIFILISGTQTSVALTLIPFGKYTKHMLMTTWTISLSGILKILLMKNLHTNIDTLVYILHGISVIPFFSIIMKNISLFDASLFILGGAIYIAGGCVYVIERPNPLPKVFGYHEVFHVMTVLANWCFFIPLLKRYITAL
ncbi:putative hemolysin III-like integral membrane protein [Ordospora colligata]|uniref:Putative hemolysin III-like integral membrane protein n=1 Tax=Ordospora colligata OC4 TaxID=1354746 RepID=A0A0B2UJG0_9MICR|nr:putative hemolysin III-like integral membrane protein [Ordospora colligata OC4]KHN69488.1 putative hemolysin III-like integral membrane protein [Ordospora colligata OC4]TBU15232.1 putative hemolysin III-like integral membrane protein [Ordospora colligata]TBU15303.1 putative hemolysin III-like integral membrane protein [Ordospora colligata]TBU18485.1 putative hemolysin III-like integral membrane protein [Ordospora colligata]